MLPPLAVIIAILVILVLVACRKKPVKTLQRFCGHRFGEKMAKAKFVAMGPGGEELYEFKPKREFTKLWSYKCMFTPLGRRLVSVIMEKKTVGMGGVEFESVVSMLTDLYGFKPEDNPALRKKGALDSVIFTFKDG